VNLGFTGAPLGLRGTVVTIYPNTGFVSVVFDEEFISGTSIEKACLKRCAAVVRWDKLLPISKPDGLGADTLAALPGSGTVLKSEPRKVDIGMTPLLGKALPSHPPAVAPAPAAAGEDGVCSITG
jgi:Xrn1 SH3-like domain